MNGTAVAVAIEANSSVKQEQKRKVHRDLNVETLYRKYHHKVYQKCLQMTRSEEDARDLSQEIWIKIIAKLPTFQYRSHPTTWLYSITHNYCIDFLRKQSKEVKFVRNYSRYVEGSGEKSTDIERKQLYEKMEGQLERYKKHDKLKILWMKYSEGQTIQQLSERMNISESAVKMRLQRAKKSLRQKIDVTID